MGAGDGVGAVGDFQALGCVRATDDVGSDRKRLLHRREPFGVVVADPVVLGAVVEIVGEDERALRTLDANDMIYQYEASREYNPAPHLEEIKAPLYAINSADDQVNPPELGILDREIKRVRNGRYIPIPISDQTRGHGTHSRPSVWGGYLRDFLSSLPER